MSTKELGDSSPTNFEKEGGKQNMSGKNTSKLVGDKGEKLACEYLVENGYKILGKNYRINFGEIDIIAQKRWKFGDLFRKNPSTRALTKGFRPSSAEGLSRMSSGQAIHFVEVKALSQVSGAFFPEQRANWKKQNKVKRLAEIWLSKNKVPENTPYQIDIIAVCFNELGGPEIKFFENVIEDK